MMQTMAQGMRGQLSERALATVLLFVALAWTPEGARALGEDLLSSPAIDTSIYKEGSIRTTQIEFGSWTALCQEIVQLRRRMCNLSSRVRDQNGHDVGNVLFATDDTGKPTIMVSLKPPIAVSEPIEVVANFKIIENKNNAHTKTKLVELAYRRAILPILCDVACKYMFPAEPKLIFSLNEGGEILIVAPLVSVAAETALSTSIKIQVARLSIQGRGFAQALEASIR